MVTPKYRECSGCGVRLPVSDVFPDERYNASAECWQLYGELNAYTVTLGDVTFTFTHQLSVDAYRPQHARGSVRPIGIAFALITLYLTCQRSYSGRLAQHLHMLLAKRSKTYPTFTPPAYVGAITIADVMQAPPGEPRDAMIHEWVLSAWEAWGAEHERVMAD